MYTCSLQALPSGEVVHQRKKNRYRYRYRRRRRRRQMVQSAFSHRHFHQLNAFQPLVSSAGFTPKLLPAERFLASLQSPQFREKKWCPCIAQIAAHF